MSRIRRCLSVMGMVGVISLGPLPQSQVRALSSTTWTWSSSSNFPILLDISDCGTLAPANLCGLDDERNTRVWADAWMVSLEQYRHHHHRRRHHRHQQQQENPGPRVYDDLWDCLLGGRDPQEDPFPSAVFIRPEPTLGSLEWSNQEHRYDIGNHLSPEYVGGRCGRVFPWSEANTRMSRPDSIAEDTSCIWEIYEDNEFALAELDTTQWSADRHALSISGPLPTVLSTMHRWSSFFSKSSFCSQWPRLWRCPDLHYAPDGKLDSLAVDAWKFRSMGGRGLILPVTSIWGPHQLNDLGDELARVDLIDQLNAALRRFKRPCSAMDYPPTIFMIGEDEIN